VTKIRRKALKLIKQAYGFRNCEYNKIEDLSAAGNFKLKGDMRLCHKPTMRQKKATVRRVAQPLRAFY
jgi:hypothetical protein